MCRSNMSTALAAPRAPGRMASPSSFCNAEERAYLRDIEKLTRLDIPRMPLPEGFDAGRDEAPAEAPRGGTWWPQWRRASAAGPPAR